MNCTLLNQFIKKNFFNSFAIYLTFALLVGQPAEAEDISFVNQQAENIRTVLFLKDDTHQRIPVATLGAGETLTLVFDEIDAEFTRTLYYRFVHCDAHFRESDLMPIEYFDGFNKEYDVETATYSLNTTVQYVHYEVQIDLTPLLISGNYLLQVFSSDDETLLVQRPLMVLENTMGIDSRLSRSTKDGGVQQLELALRTGSEKVIDVQREVTLVLQQNNRLDDVHYVSEPSIIRPGEYVYMGLEGLSFEAGNEYRWVDNRDFRYSRMNTQSFEFFDPFYHQTLGVEGRPRGYSYHEDFNGGRYIECQYPSNSDADYQGDYTITHFSFASREDLGDVYVAGALTNNVFTSENRMTYDATTGLYSVRLLLKQGLHNYQYLTVPCEGCAANSLATENSFADTENDYAIYVYFRPLSGDYDRLVCIKRHNSMTTQNAFVY